MIPFSLLPEGLETSKLERFDPRLRILGALLATLTIVSLQQLPLLTSLLALCLLLARWIGLTVGFLAKRLLALEGFMLVLLVMLPFTVSGESWLTLGPFSASWEGLYHALEILLKANTIVLLLMSLVGTLEPVTLGHALHQLGVPQKLVHLFLLTVRYIGVLFEEYARLRQAMRARAFVAGSNRHTWRSYGWLLGMLLVRSLERAQRILQAMKCRGFNGHFYLINQNRWRATDTLGFFLLILFIVLLQILERVT